MAFVGFPDGVGVDEARMLAWWRALTDDPHRHHFTIESDDLGFCGEAYYAAAPGERAATVDVKLVPAARGRGWGTLGLSAMLDEVFEHSAVEACFVDPHRGNEPALRLYERLGFRRAPWPAERPGDVDHVYLEITRQEWREHRVALRREEPRDHRAVEELTRDSFWGLFAPRCDEHLVAHLLRESPALVPELDVVAEVDGTLVGHVMYSRATVVEPATGTAHDVLTFGPLSVRPDRQGDGIGAALMRHTLAAAADLGHRAVVVYGHPDYYPRFGFRPAAASGITAPAGAAFDALMALPLVPGGLDGVTGQFHEDPVFVVDPERVAEFDRGFPPRPDAVLHPLRTIEGRLPGAATESLRALGIRHLEDLRRMSRAEVAAAAGLDDEACDALRGLLAEHGIRWGHAHAHSPWTGAADLS